MLTSSFLILFYLKSVMCIAALLNTFFFFLQLLAQLAGPKSQKWVRCLVSPTWRGHCFPEVGGYGVGYPGPPFSITSGSYTVFVVHFLF
ncbi:hypothetical protein PGB90_003470 [Kerria lacca]